MPRFGKLSLERLETCDERLQQLFQRVVSRIDCSVVDGHRTKEQQESAFNSRKSQRPWPLSLHNSMPSLAIDVVPYPINWDFEEMLKSDNPLKRHAALKNIERWAVFAGYVLGTANEMKIPVRWGGDWNGNFNMADERFLDWPHWEIVANLI